MSAPDRAAATDTGGVRNDRSEPDRRRVEGGFVAVEWIAAVVFLLLPVVFIGAGVSRWPERQQVARAAASEGARAAVLARTQAQAVADANTVAGQAVNAANWTWGQPVSVTVTMSMPAIDVPGMGSWAASSWSATSTQRIEDYRGLP